jgi:hypothetical protein
MSVLGKSVIFDLLSCLTWSNSNLATMGPIQNIAKIDLEEMDG